MSQTHGLGCVHRDVSDSLHGIGRVLFHQVGLTMAHLTPSNIETPPIFKPFQYLNPFNIPLNTHECPINTPSPHQHHSGPVFRGAPGAPAGAVHPHHPPGPRPLRRTALPHRSRVDPAGRRVGIISTYLPTYLSTMHYHALHLSPIHCQ